MRQGNSEAAHSPGRPAFSPKKDGDMNSAISPTAGASGLNSITAAGAPAGPARAEQSQAAGSPVSLQAIPSSPPAEVLDEMARAAEVYDRLSAQGRTLHFTHDAVTQRPAVEVRDRHGSLVGQISLAQALDVAAGAPLE
jgi:hypothetical protein